MISADTNLFIYAFNRESKVRAKALAFFESVKSRTDFVLCELVLLEVYMALRNPVIFSEPYTAPEAAKQCDALRENGAWQIVDYAPEIRNQLWKHAAKPGIAFRKVIDVRLALTLRHHGVTDFATANTRHFADVGFARVWNPLAE